MKRPNTNANISQADKDYRESNGNPLSSSALIDLIRAKHGNKLLMSFSRGKDSLAAWLYLRDRGFELYPYYLYVVPDTAYAEHEIEYYESFFGTQILCLPHPLFVELLNDRTFQPPENAAVILAANLPEPDYADIDKVARSHYGLPDDTLCAVGLRAKDNMERRRLIYQQGAVGMKRRRYYYPIWDWDIEQTCQIILDHDCAVTTDYDLLGRTLTAFDYQYLKPLVDHSPGAYGALKRWFPLIDLELYRHEVVNAYAAEKTKV